MIRYALACQKGHAFESWFRSSDDFDAQTLRKLVSCPVCGATEVQKQIMAPQIARTDLAQAETPVALLDDDQRKIRALIADIHQHLKQNSEDVGASFADEARKIHHGETEARAIHGKATGEEVRALAEEGVGFLPIPVLPDERN